MNREKVENGTNSNAIFGVALFLISEAFLFGSLFWTYFYLRHESPVWPPERVHLNTTMALINTALLVISSLVISRTSKFVRAKNKAGLLSSLGITALLGTIFLGVTVFEWTRENLQPWTHAYGSIFYTLTGFHGLHVLAGISYLLILFNRTLNRPLPVRADTSIEAGAFYWHYVDFIWILVFISIFIIR